MTTRVISPESIREAGKPGRPAQPTEHLLARGSQHGRRRARKEDDRLRIGQHKTRAIERTENLAQLLSILPGYDPYRDAEDYYWDEEEAQWAIAFFPRYLRHCKGRLASKPFHLLDWEKALVANLFGWRHRETGLRRYKECLIYIAKKNGKSALAAGIILQCLYQDNQVGAEIYSCASTREQASHVFSHATGMVRQSQELQRHLTIYGAKGGSHIRAIVYDEQLSTYRPIAADANSADGSNVYLAVIDELHRFNTDRQLELCQVMEMGTAARDESLILYTTTADYDRESICNVKREYALKVRDGVVEDPKFLPCVYELPKDVDWHDKSLWVKSNPSLGETVTMEYLEREHSKACELMSVQNSFLRLHLNILTQSDEAWLDLSRWDEQERKYTADRLKGKRCFAGLDLASIKDFCALVLFFPCQDGFYTLPYFWAPRDSAEKREKEDKVPYTAWERAGLIELTAGEVTDYAVILERIKQLGEEYKIQEIAVDPHNAMTLMTALEAEGFEVVKFPQTYTNYTGPCRELEKLITSQSFYHNGHKVLRWMASNVCLDQETTSDRVKPSRKRSTEKIDGIVALLMAIARQQQVAPKRESVYAKRGLFQW
jgi:phage terminase large subunit-like protein